MALQPADEDTLRLTARFDSLSPDQIEAVDVIVDAYKSFWKHVRFRKGWTIPYFTIQEVSPLLYKAAEIVFRIRDVFDSENTDIKIRQIDGAAQEYLWSLTEQKTKPSDHPEQFLRDLVHATLKENGNYPYSLVDEKIDQWIVLIKQYMESPKTLWSDLEDQRNPQEVLGLVKRYKVFSTTEFQDLTIVEYTGISCLNAPVLACYSAIGLLSAIVGNQLVKSFKLPLIGHIESPYFQVSATIQGEQPMWPVRFYGNRDLVVFIGGFEIPEPCINSLVEATVDFSVRHKSTMIYTVEGFPVNEKTSQDKDEETEVEGDDLILIDDGLLTKLSLREEDKNHPETPLKTSPGGSKGSSKKSNVEEPSISELAKTKYGRMIHYVTTDNELAKNLHSLGHIPCVDAILPGFTGVLLSQAPLCPIDVTAIFAPNSTVYPDFQAAIHPFKLINSLLSKQADISFSIKSLYQDGAKITKAIQESKKQLKDLRSSGQVGMYG